MLSAQWLQSLAKRARQPSDADIPKLCQLPTVLSAACLRSEIDLGKPLGSGRHGSVYAAEEHGGSTLALKCIPLTALEPEEQWSQAQLTLDEIYAVLCCNALLELGILHFPRVHNIHLLDEQLERWRLQSELTWCIAMERCEGTLRDWKPRGCPPETPLLIAVQLFAAFYALGTCFRVCNNDAYSRNILWTAERPQLRLLYSFGGVQLLVPSAGCLWKLTDFGLATHGAQHKHHFEWLKEQVHHPSTGHVSLIERFPRYARDVSALLSDLTKMFPASQWLCATNYYLDRCLHSHKLDSCQGLASFVQHVTSPEFLGATALPPTLLSPSLTRCKQLASQGNLRVCNVDAVQVKAVRAEVHAKFHTLKEAMLNEIFKDDASMPTAGTSDESLE